MDQKPMDAFNTGNAPSEAVPPPLPYKPFTDECNDFRRQIGHLGNQVRTLMNHPEFKTVQRPDDPNPRDAGEMKANIMLAFRHLEDARMRLGKAIQASEGGVSCYDK